MNYLEVPAGRYAIGANRVEISRAVEYWQHRLLENFTRADIESWFAKEYPKHAAELQAFALGRTLVTNGEFRAYVAATGAPPAGSLRDGEPEDHPVWGLGIEDARAYARWLSASDPDHTYRLPREREWEAAARGREGREYPYGRDFDPSLANTVESRIGRTTPVEAYAHAPGPFGHLDLAGNVEEWVDDVYHVYPGGELVRDDLYQVFGMNYHVLRGGSFHRGGDLARGARRHGAYPSPDYRFTGFRLVRTPRGT